MEMFSDSQVRIACNSPIIVSNDQHIHLAFYCSYLTYAPLLSVGVFFAAIF